MPVSEATSADVLEILAPIWHTKPPTARIVRHRIRAVLEWAIAMDWRTDNPCDRLLPVLGPQHHLVRHRKALPHREVGAAIEKVRAAKADEVDALAFEFMVLTAARGVEVRGAVWGEIDRAERVWTVPTSRMKNSRPRRMPLCGRALEILDAARKLGGGGSPIVFVGKRGREMGGEQMGRLLRKHGIAAVLHGFRSSFRDWAAEETDHPREGRRGGLGPCRPESGRARLHALRPVRAPPSAHGRLGAVPRWREAGPRAAPSSGPRRAVSQVSAGLAHRTLRWLSQPTPCATLGWRGVAPPPLQSPGGPPRGRGRGQGARTPFPVAARLDG